MVPTEKLGVLKWIDGVMLQLYSRCAQLSFVEPKSEMPEGYGLCPVSMPLKRNSVDHRMDFENGMYYSKF